MSNTFLNLTPSTKIAPKGQKIAPKGPKSGKDAPNVVELKQKKRLCFQKLSCLCTYVGPKKVFEPNPNPKNSSEGSQNCKKKAPIVAKIKTKDGAGCTVPQAIMQSKSFSESAFEGLSMLQSCVLSIPV